MAGDIPEHFWNFMEDGNFDNFVKKERTMTSTSKRYPPVDSVKAARDKEKRQRRKPAEDDAPVEPVIIKSPSRRYEGAK